MMRTKKDVDRHVKDIFQKLPNENEKTLRCYKIAELYYNVNDFESAKRYLSRYNEVRKEARAYKLMGQILEALGQKEAALVQYKYSFELNAKQEDLILKICELLADPEVGIDVNSAKYWIDRADSLFPRHSIVFQLKEKVLSIEKPSNNEGDLEKLILVELNARPTDVRLRVKLIKHYMDNSKFEDAYRHASEIEAKSLHRDSLLWYQTLCDLFLKFKSTKQMNWNFWILYISSLERYATLTIKEQGCSVKKSSEAVQAVYNFDQHLFEAKAQSFTSYPTLTEKIFEHMWGQLHFHIACLLLLNSKFDQSRMTWSEISTVCSPLLLSAVHIKPIDLTASWAAHVDSPVKNLLQLYYQEGSYRCSQAGHIIQDYCRSNQKKFFDVVEKFCSGSWRERVYQRVFVGRIYQKVRSSYFTNNNVLSFPLRRISHDELKRYDEVAEEVWPYSLHHQVWPSIKSRSSEHTMKCKGPQPNLSSHIFPDFQFTVFNASNASPISICQLDIDAFLNAAALCASAIDEEKQKNTLLSPHRLPTLPADLTNPLCNEEQEKWWFAVCKLYRKETGGEMGEIRQTIQRGLEVIRCIGNHGLDPVILVHLARIFQYRAQKLKEKDSESSYIPALESRSELYWSAVIPLLERLQYNQTIRMTSVKLFEYSGKTMNNTELAQAIEEGKLLLAKKLVKDELYEQAIEALQALKSPDASFEQGKIYKKLADELINSHPKENVTSEMRSQHIIIISKARNCFYLTLDRLKEFDAELKHPLNAELHSHITEIENELKKIDPDTAYSDEESYSSAHSEEHPIVLNTLPMFNNTSSQTPIRNSRRTQRQASTPRHFQTPEYLDVSQNRTEARPSPERLDAQIRQLVHSVDSLKEQNRAVLSKLDELIKITIRNTANEAPKQRSQKNISSTTENEIFGYDDNEYRDFNNFNNTSVSNNTSAANRGAPIAPIPQNLFATQRQLFPPLIYPHHINPSTYFQGPLPSFPDQASMYANAAALAAAAATSYPAVPSMYRTSLEQQSLSSMQHMTENMQQGLFSQRMNEYNQLQQSQQSQQPLGLLVNEPSKSEPKLGFTATNELTMPDISTLVLKDSTVSAPSLSFNPTSKVEKLPVNVVITTSDTLPTTTPTSRPTLSVTIPAHHRLGVTTTQEQNIPHSYQIQMPAQPTILTTVSLPPLSTTLIMTSPITRTNVTDNQNTSILSTGSRHNSSDTAEVEHDPIPDFAPIIPLPDEVPVTTGEENEETLFCARAKLFRFVDKEWKERGVGNVKLLKSEDGRIRLVMRREQVHKICANHMLRKDMELTQMPNNENAYMWVANDFADEEVKLEKLCIRFKTAEEALSFKESFDKAKESLAEVNDKSAGTKQLANTGSKTEKPTAEAHKSAQTKAGVEKFSGFTFSSTPVVQKPVEEIKPQQPAKSSPFASFTFGKTAEASKAPSFTFGIPTAAATTVPSSTSFGQDSSKSTVGVSQLAETAKISEKEPSEIVVLEQKASFMQFCNSTQIWNDKGKGVVKVLTDSKNNRVRILMNSEDNSKTLLNEVILPTTVFKCLKSDQVTWTTSNQAKPDTFLLKFNSHEQASLFKTTLTVALQNRSTARSVQANQQKPLSELFKPAAGSWECQACYTSNGAMALSCLCCQTPKPSSAPPSAPSPPTSKTPESVSRNLFEQFKPPPAGSWECKDCYTRNNPGATTCICCEAVSPLSNTWNCKKCKIVNITSNKYCVACDEPKDPSMPPKPKTSGGFSINSQKSDFKSTFSFGIPQANQLLATPKDTSSNLSFNFSKLQGDKPASSIKPIFGANNAPTTPSTGFSFSSQPPKTPPPTNSVNMKFGSPGKSFDFQFQAKSPQSPDRPETSDDEQVEESEDVYFAPVIPLPDKIEVKTGEENEDVLYCHRAKLFKFDQATKEWKERGLGDIKLLRHVETKKLRLVMRRDQVLKLCLNHAISSAIEISVKDDKTWMWSAGDYSEGEVEFIQFACRFKTPEIAEEFKKAVDDACKEADAGAPKTVTTTTKIAGLTKKESSEEIEIVYEVSVTPEEKAAALKLRLPENFYAYKYKADCPGCIGCCEPEQPLLKPVDSKITTSESVFGTISSINNMPFTSIFGKPAASFGTPTSTIFGGSKNESGNEAKSTGFVFDSTALKPDSQNIGFDNLKICTPMTKQQATTATTATNSASNIFGGFSVSSVATTTSGSTNIFSGTNTFGASQSMFSGSIAKTSTTPAFSFSPSSTTSVSTTANNTLFEGNNPFSAGTNTFSVNKFGGGSVTTAASTTSSSSLFSSTTTPAKPIFEATVSPMFGSNAPATSTIGSIFGASTGTVSVSPAFGALATSVSVPLIFSTNTATTSALPIFGASTTTSSTSVFGSTAATTSATLVFGASSTTSSTSLLGSTTATTSATPIFGTTTTSSEKTLFGSNATTLSVAPIFGTTTTSSEKTLFGSNATTSSVAPIFGTTTTSSEKTLFGSNATTSSVAPIFGTTTTSSEKTLFGSNATTSSVAPIFGTTTTSSITTLFGSNATTSSVAPIFGNTTITKSATPVFGATATSSSPFGASTTTTTATSLFGGTNTFSSVSSMFSNQKSITPVFGSTAPQIDTKQTTTSSITSTTVPTNTSLSFSSKPTFNTGSAQPVLTAESVANASNSSLQESKTNKKEFSGVSFLPTDNSLSFSALAAQSKPDQQPAFQSADPNFKFDGAGSSVFGAKPKKSVTKKTTNKSPNTKKDKSKNDNDGDSDEEDENGDDHDPYFEPIIPLPDAIEVRTGEEDEEKIFSHRAKLYRFDENTKEWKERGTGEMKILYHAENGTYRLLLRREQVYKVVCNQRLTPEIEFHKMATSTSAWVWATMNYAEPENPQIEKLAVRFKSQELAQEFKKAIDNAQSALVERQNKAPVSFASPLNYNRELNAAEENNQDYEDDVYDDEDYYDRDDYDEDEEDDDDDEDDHVKMFEKRATIYFKNDGDNDWDDNVMGNLKVFYDSDMYGVRILFQSDNSNVISDTVISMNTQMQCVEKECTWTATDYAVDPPIKRIIKAVFSSTQTSQEMYETFVEGKECATKADIRDI